MSNRFLPQLVRFATLAWCASSLCAAEKARVEVLPDQVIGRVNRLILGNNMLAYQGPRDEYGNRGAGIWDPEQRRPVPEYVELAKQAGLSVSRWPGGCGAHNYNWKLTVGPLDKRPTQQFGLPEFLAFCEATESAPILTVACYWGGPADGADLVEYLNAPSDGSNPNADTDWAAVRAGDGHPKPYGVVWFEYGNESYHGEHEPAEGRKEKRKYSPEEYAKLYLEYQRAMKAVDPRIKLGGLIQNGLDEWNRTVLRIAGKPMDFGIEHTYTPGHGGDTTADSNRPFMQACAACGDRIQRIYDGLNKLVEDETGRTDLPWAITEYNGHFVQSKPLPYRQTLGNALRNAEHVRVMMQPGNRIALANFWQFSNEYWGMAQGYVHKGEPLVKQANYYVYQLYHEHFGDTLIGAKVTCGRWDFPGGAWLPARTGEPSQFRLFDENLLPTDYEWRVSQNPSVKQRLDRQTLIAEFSGKDTNYYHGTVELPAKPNTGYRVTGEIKTVGLKTATGVGFQVGDARGWIVTKSCALGGDLRGDSDWTQVVIDYTTLPDTNSLTIQTRRIGDDGGTDPIAGTAHYRLKSVQQFRPENSGGVPDLSVNAAKRADGSLTLMIVNTNLDEDLDTEVAVPGRTPGAAAQAKAWSLVGPTAWATNVGTQREVTLVETPVRKSGSGWQVTLPKHSLTAVELRP
jgi:alpha-N-arabinofuranosidase